MATGRSGDVPRRVSAVVVAVGASVLVLVRSSRRTARRLVDSCGRHLRANFVAHRALGKPPLRHRDSGLRDVERNDIESAPGKLFRVVAQSAPDFQRAHTLSVDLLPLQPFDEKYWPGALLASFREQSRARKGAVESAGRVGHPIGPRSLRDWAAPLRARLCSRKLARRRGFYFAWRGTRSMCSSRGCAPVVLAKKMIKSFRVH